MSLITAKELAKVIKLDKLGFIGTSIGWGLLHLLRLAPLNKIYDKNKDLQGLEFLNTLLKEFKVHYEIPEDDLRKIPKEGAFITISNHPLGGLDGILLLKILIEQRPDYKVMANFLLTKIKPLAPYIIQVNPFENHKEVSSSLMGFKQSIEHLKEGKPLGMFPAGEVSTQPSGNIYVDKTWDKSAIKLIKKANVPVIPIYFHAKNSPLFYQLAKQSDTLRTAKLPSELLSQKNKTIGIRIGRPISPKTQDEIEDLYEFSNFLRRKTYLLSNTYEQKKHFKSFASMIRVSKDADKDPQEIAPATPPEVLEEEINALRAKKVTRLLQHKEYEIFLAKAEDIPNILHEIGRLRELTFREVGEGTNLSIDLDEYDTYYRHLFLWESDTKRIIGAYRMGLGSDFFDLYGINGFYTHSLFRFEPELYTMMRQTIEMGRAFVVSEYQQKPMPLFLLWKGIALTTLHFPEHKYLLGGVSISNQFSDFSKSLMIEFMKSNYYDPYIAQYVKPKKEYKVKLKDADKDFIFDETQSDLNKFDKIIDELEPGNLRLPVLIKKYIKQNAKVIAFNVDPLFNNAVDGLMYIRIDDLPESTIKPAIEEFQSQLERGEF
ncbi:MULTISPECIES: GNAT family N-acyltransferase [unclassified Capnocytophaga]|uniref:GNAT family N-acyltransferase n=1 Tax=unclassified Capnocytophaga TaxID=2640652 RepID=UPI000202F4DD|nr:MULTISPECIES: lysophospholipid acyltransferase family protein [unclassified Capnocytophaga]EGD33628.1 hemolysin [Capnocytophaga sp. oral taxon 338 str. F0234]MEB3004456.1 lysophospholipid acyltransferase family protein [Capnocytophaga sp. G2]